MFDACRAPSGEGEEEEEEGRGKKTGAHAMAREGASTLLEAKLERT